MVSLERLGIATAAVATAPFVDEALEQARLLAMPDYRMVYIPHPVQLLSVDEVHELADRAWPEILAALTTGVAVRRPAVPPARSRSRPAPGPPPR